jgi:hypothetical protein
MDDGSTISSDAVVALSRAIDAAMDRGDMNEATRLASLRGAELNRWLEAHGYPRLRDNGECVLEASGPPLPCGAGLAVGRRISPVGVAPCWLTRICGRNRHSSGETTAWKARSQAASLLLAGSATLTADPSAPGPPVLRAAR